VAGCWQEEGGQGWPYRDDGLAIVKCLDIHSKAIILLDQVNLHILLLLLPASQALIKNLHPVTSNVDNVARNRGERERVKNQLM